jgi:transcriptional regulator with GAF, ATPase, and Fis domain
LLEKAMAVTEARIGSLYMVEIEERRFRIIAARGLESAPKKDSFIDFDDSMARLVVADGKPLLFQDNATGAGANGSSGPPCKAASFLSMPISVGGNLTATLNLSHIDSKDEEILSIMIDEVGFALENVMLLSEIEQHLTNLHDEPTVELTTENDQLEREIV